MSLSKWLPCDFEQCHPLLWGGGILVDHWSTISSYVTPSLIDWVHTQNDLRSTMYFYLMSIENLNLNKWQKKSLLTLSHTLFHFVQALLCFKHRNPVKTKIACLFHHCYQRQPILTQYYNVAQMWGIWIVAPSWLILLTSANRRKVAVH